MSYPLYDMHCHLGFCKDPSAVAEELGARGVAGGLCCTVTPGECARVSPLLDGRPGWAVGVGLHPWWAHKEEADAHEAARLVSEGAHLVGEVGLDFGTAHRSTQDKQVTAFGQVLDAVQPGSVLSLHTVRAADVVLDMLETRGLTTSCTCAFHWFSGSSNELHRALGAGCRFSVGVLMLRSRRGREYARQLPLDRLLLETDFPDPDRPEPADMAASRIAEALQDACIQIAGLRQIEVQRLAERAAANSQAILDRLA